MKIVFSRKGFDGSAGGCPSPIVDGRPLSLPIPTKMPTPTRYEDLPSPYADLVFDLTRGRLGGESWCHLDPDINLEMLPRRRGWRGALGQVSAAQGHLTNQGVEPGDVFVFWGVFRPVAFEGRWKFTGRPEHRIWGWLQVGEIVDLGPDGSEAAKERTWLGDHPHVRAGWGKRNVLYIASKRLILGSRAHSRPGFGVLAQGHRLSEEGRSPSIWRAPDWLHPLRGGSGMTYHKPHS